ncbi:sialidase family protein [Aeoliella sp.]|uniref:sialidase family protein n=1 Tax=Aeoliella sp. TaxID=2795800 RepID=UPI003CCBD10F
MKYLACGAACLFAFSCLAMADEPGDQPVTLSLLESTRIWDQAPHNAFTDLVQWRDQYVCAFREGRKHVSTDGAIRVLTSPDGKEWQPAARLELPGYDLRDASLSVMPDGRLMVLGGAAPRKADHKGAPTGTFTATATDIDQWTTPEIIVEPGRWLWRVTWQGDVAWGVAYAKQEGRPYTSLLKLRGSNDVATHVADMFGEGYPTEATIRFAPDGTMLCLQRRDGEPGKRSAHLGVSSAPYTDWKWHDLGEYLGGPNFIRTAEGNWLAAGRMFIDDEPRTVVSHLDVENAKFTKLSILPSGGDCSYPGLVLDGDRLLVSYYSSHEGKTAIYMAELRLEE